LKVVHAKNSRQSEAVKAAWAERKGYVAALEERCRNLELELERQKNLHGPLLESERIYSGALADAENRLVECRREGAHRTRVAQQYFDVARNLGLKPGPEQAEPWLLQREEP